VTLNDLAKHLVILEASRDLSAIAELLVLYNIIEQFQYFDVLYYISICMHTKLNIIKLNFI